MARRSLLFVDGSLLVNDDGLHGMLEKCGSKHLSSGAHVIYIEGFQAGGGVGMEVKYSGPDTGGRMLFMRSGSIASSTSTKQYYPTCDPNAQTPEDGYFIMCMFRSEIFLGSIPKIGQADSGINRLYYVGQSKISSVNFRELGQFRAAVPSTPDANYAWAVMGTLKIGVAGSYSLCIESDDG